MSSEDVSIAIPASGEARLTNGTHEPLTNGTTEPLTNGTEEPPPEPTKGMLKQSSSTAARFRVAPVAAGKFTSRKKTFPGLQSVPKRMIVFILDFVFNAKE